MKHKECVSNDNSNSGDILDDFSTNLGRGRSGKHTFLLRGNYCLTQC